MVQGIETFKQWFESYSTRFVIIGGTACNLIYAEYGAPERATHDIDMVLWPRSSTASSTTGS